MLQSRRLSIPPRRALSLFALIVIMSAATAHERRIAVYDEQSKYLGCRTSGDSTDDHTYDPRISEAECESLSDSRPTVAGYVFAGRVGGFQTAASHVFSGFSIEDDTFTSNATRTSSLVGGGTLFHFRSWIALDLALAGARTQMSRVDTRLETPEETVSTLTANATLRLGTAAARLYPIQSTEIHPWLLVGVRGISVMPTDGTRIREGRRTTLSAEQLRSAGTSHLLFGVGVELPLFRRLAVEFSGMSTFEGGWAIQFAVKPKKGACYVVSKGGDA